LLVADKPKIVCESVVRVKINMPNFSLMCKTYSNPEVKLAKIYWKFNSDINETFEASSKNEDYLANITMVSCSIDEISCLWSVRTDVTALYIRFSGIICIL
jgi:hypothetical protein